MFPSFRQLLVIGIVWAVVAWYTVAVWAMKAVDAPFGEAFSTFYALRAPIVGALMGLAWSPVFALGYHPRRLRLGHDEGRDPFKDDPRLRHLVRLFRGALVGQVVGGAATFALLFLWPNEMQNTRWDALKWGFTFWGLYWYMFVPAAAAAGVLSVWMAMRHREMKGVSLRPVVLLILDGVGWGRRDDTDAVCVANTPTLDSLIGQAPWTLLKAHGTAVGLPSDADMGNSEVGHNAMGAGRVVDQGAKLVDRAIESGSIWQGNSWKSITRCRTVHFIGLVSDGNVHSHVKHLRALVARAVADGVQRVRVHALTDGRDVSARSALQWIMPLEEELSRYTDACIASGGGRMVITMDRYEADWGMVERGWHTHVHGQGRAFASASDAISVLYAEDPAVDDQRLPPFVVHRDGSPVGTIQDGDAVVFFNFRGDRAVEICRAFEERGFDKFDRGAVPSVNFAGMMQYDGDLELPKHFLVDPPSIGNTVAEAMARAAIRTAALAETQKYGHVTYFWNGNRSGKVDDELEEYLEVPSDNVPFDRAPEMKAEQVTGEAIEALATRRYDHVRVNLANGDMVGHTGNFAATVKAIECVDRCLDRFVAACREQNAILLVTADHGNADEMYELKPDGSPVLVDGKRKPRTSHSLNPVPFILVDSAGEWTLAAEEGAGIASVGSTLLHLLGVARPEGYAPSLVRRAR